MSQQTQEAGKVMFDGTVNGQGRWHKYVFTGIVVLLCLWVLVPIYLLVVNTLSSPGRCQRIPQETVSGC